MGNLVGCQRCGYKHNLEDCPRCNPKNTGLDELDMLRMIAILARKTISIDPDYFKQGCPETLKWAVEDYDGAFRK